MNRLENSNSFKALVRLGLVGLLICSALLGLDCVGPLLKAQRQDYVQAHPELTSLERQRILAGKIWLGMTAEQLEASWGRPQNVNRSVGRWGEHIQAVYGRFPYSTYVYLENGIVTGWSD